MSRAFVDEDSKGDDGLPEIPLPLPAGAKNYSTPEGAARLSEELSRLMEHERPRALAALAVAQGRSHAAGGPAAEVSGEGSSGDEENALRALAELDRRIDYLNRMKSLIEVVEPPEKPERVSFGVTVEVEEEDTSRRNYRIVGADESDPDRGRLSWASPVARALMGKGKGDTARVRLPMGEKTLIVIDFPKVDRP